MPAVHRTKTTDPLAELDIELAPLATREQVALVTGLSLRCIDRALARGELACVHVGRAVRIPRAAVRAWLSRGLVAV